MHNRMHIVLWEYACSNVRCAVAIVRMAVPDSSAPAVVIQHVPVVVMHHARQDVQAAVVVGVQYFAQGTHRSLYRFLPVGSQKYIGGCMQLSELKQGIKDGNLDESEWNAILMNSGFAAYFGSYFLAGSCRKSCNSGCSSNTIAGTIKVSDFKNCGASCAPSCAAISCATCTIACPISKAVE